MRTLVNFEFKSREFFELLIIYFLDESCITPIPGDLDRSYKQTSELSSQVDICEHH